MLSWKVWHHSPSDVVPHPRNMEHSIDMLWKLKNAQIKVVHMQFMGVYRGAELFHGVTASHIHWIGGWVVITASLHTFEKRKFSCPSWQWIIPWLPSLHPSVCTNYTVPGLLNPDWYRFWPHVTSNKSILSPHFCMDFSPCCQIQYINWGSFRFQSKKNHNLVLGCTGHF